MNSCTAFAPATVANVAVGFDVLGFAIDGVGDEVTASRDDQPAITIDGIDGVVTDLPTDPGRNTASVAVRSLLDEVRPAHGVRLRLRKGIPLGSGMGGSAASAVAAVVAANGLLDEPLPRERLLRHAVEGERAASGAPHADNAAPSLLGGLVAVVHDDPLEVVSVPLPESLHCVLVHPHLRIDTREARGVLPASIPLGDHVRQSMRLCGFLSGCHRGDLELLGRSMEDLIAEPYRAKSIPGFAEAGHAARDSGAVAFAIAGSGPSVFAWTDGAATARRVEAAIRRAFGECEVRTDGHVGPIQRGGAAVRPGGGA